MATLIVTELIDERDSESTLGGEGNEGVVNTYTRKFMVRSDTVIGPQTAKYAPGIPAVGDPYQTQEESDPGALCNSVKATARNDTRRVFTVVVSYSSSKRDVGALSKEIAGADDGQPGSGDKKSPNSQQQSNPESMAPEVTVDYREMPKVLTRDLDGKQACNSADEPFDPPIEYPELFAVIRVTRTVKNHNFNDEKNKIVVNQNAVDVGKFGLAGAGTLLQVGVSAREVSKNGQTYVQETREYFHNPDGWDIEKLDIGLREKTVGDGGAISYKPILIKGDDGIERPVSSPVPLNGNGVRAAVGGLAEVLKFRVREAIAFERA